MEDVLQNLDLTKNQANVYLTLLDIGPSSADKIARKSNIHRRSVYDITNSLIKKGLVSFFSEDNKKMFQPTSPEKLLDMVKEKEDMIKSILPQLKKRHQKTKKGTKTNAEIYLGKDGLKTICNKILDKKELLAIGSAGLGEEMFPFFLHRFRQTMSEKNITYKLLAARTKLSEKAMKIRKEQIPQVEHKFLPHYIKHPLLVWIFENNVALIPSPPDLKPEKIIAFLITNKATANSFKKYFNWLWNVARK